MIHRTNRLVSSAFAVTLAATATAACATAQQPAPPTPAPTAATTPAAAASPTAPALKVGDAAPDFSLPAATRYGLLAQPVKLSDLRGETVVLAFFFKARTKG